MSYSYVVAWKPVCYFYGNFQVKLYMYQILFLNHQFKIRSAVVAVTSLDYAGGWEKATLNTVIIWKCSTVSDILPKRNNENSKLLNPYEKSLFNHFEDGFHQPQGYDATARGYVTFTVILQLSKYSSTLAGWYTEATVEHSSQARFLQLVTQCTNHEQMQMHSHIIHWYVREYMRKYDIYIQRGKHTGRLSRWTESIHPYMHRSVSHLYSPKKLSF